jgi:glycosyltransferase involved in cell wall biosynthesis
MLIVHLTASTFYGGPERQMLGLARSLSEADESVFVSFAEGGRCRPFLSAARQQGFEAVGLKYDTPRLGSAVNEIAELLAELQADVLCCHGYKANLLGRRAARRHGIPAVAVARGWTGESWRVRLYERIDRWHLRKMDRVVCVSEAQAERVRRCGVPPDRVRVIRNAIDPDRFSTLTTRYRSRLERYFRPARTLLVGAAGRLSPEKGFDVLVSAAARVVQRQPSAGFVLFGEGACRESLQQQIKAAGLSSAFVLGGFRPDLDRFLPHFDLFVLPSHTEGLPNVVLEACAAGVPVVATAVGGTPEVIEDGVTGHLVPAGNPEMLAYRIETLLANAAERRGLGRCGRLHVLEQFGFAAQADQYRRLFEELCPAAALEPVSTEAPPPPDTPTAPATDPDLLAARQPCDA